MLIKVIVILGVIVLATFLAWLVPKHGAEADLDDYEWHDDPSGWGPDEPPSSRSARPKVPPDMRHGA